MNWISVEESLPLFSDGLVDLKHINGTEYRGQFNELGDWWRIPTGMGILRIDLEDEQITHWKFKEIIKAN